MSQHFFYPPNSASIPGTVSADQGDPNTLANAWPVKITDGVDLALVNASGELLVAASVLPLPSGAATAAKQDTGNASLASIDTKLTNPLPVSGPLTDVQLRAVAVPVSGPLTDAQLRAVAVPVSLSSVPLPSGAATEATLSAFSAKSASAAVHEAFDYQSITYVGATTNISTVVYKSGGSGGTTVATLTMGYDGSSRLTSVTKT